MRRSLFQQVSRPAKPLPVKKGKLKSLDANIETAATPGGVARSQSGSKGGTASRNAAAAAATESVRDAAAARAGADSTDEETNEDQTWEASQGSHSVDPEDVGSTRSKRSMRTQGTNRDNKS